MALADGTARTISAIRTLLGLPTGRIVRRSTLADMFETLQNRVKSFMELTITADVETANFTEIMTGGTKSAGSFKFNAVPTALDTITINGVVLKFTAAASDVTTAGTTAVPYIINIKGTAELQSNEVATQLNASTHASLTIATYDGTTADTTGVTVDMPGTVGDEFTLEDTSLTIAATVTALTGGVDMVAKAIAAAPNLVGGVTMSVSADVGNAVTITGQAVDANGADLAEATQFMYFLSSDAAGQAVSAAPDGGIAMGTDGTMIVEFTAEVVGWFTTEADGDFDIVVTDAGAFTSYLVVMLPSGRRVISDVITHGA